MLGKILFVSAIAVYLFTGVLPKTALTKAKLSDLLRCSWKMSD